MPLTSASTETANSLQRTPDLDALAQAFNGFIYICSQDYRIQYMNDKLRERTGYDATGEYCYKIFHGCDTVCSWCQNDRLFRDLKPIRHELKSPKDERWYHSINTPIRNPDGTFSRQALIMDITESYLAREELSLFQTLISQSNDAIFVLDADTSAFVFINDKACSSLGYSAAELLMLRGIDISASLVDMSSWYTHAARILKKSRNFEAEHIHKDGSHIPVEITASYVNCREKNFILLVVRDISDRKIFEHELERQAQSDYLTGLANRRHFIKRGEEEIARALRYGHPMSLLILDIDCFKGINDTHGHHAGDIALQMFAAHCQEALREIDIIGRIGGEEFAVILPETDGEDAYDVAERLRQSIASQTMTTEQGASIGLTVSIGLTTFAGGGEANLDTLLRQADEALYRAKCSGRNRVVHLQLLKSSATASAITVSLALPVLQSDRK